MKISLNWLKEFVDIPVDAPGFAEKITQIGLAVDSREDQNGDTILDLDVTTNRPDCLSHLGVAREAAAVFRQALRKPGFALKETGEAVSSVFSVTINDPQSCPRYCGRYIAGVKIGPSPAWLRERLEALGVRAINNVTDITNFVMLELGQPMHAFDADKLNGGKIVVRHAHAGESMTTLDGVSRTLDPSILVIADSSQAVAIAGVMGGAGAEISPATVNVFLESAYFHPQGIRKAARALGMSTEASYRFERGADIEMARHAVDRAAAMMADLAGGRVYRDAIDAYPTKRESARASLKRASVPAFLGAPVEDAAIDGIFERLEFKPQRTESGWTVEVPTFRPDIAGEQDLLEEVARHYGFDRFPSRRPAWRGFGAALPHEGEIRRLRGVLSAQGYSEIYTYSFGDESLGRRFHPGAEPVRLRNPMSEDASVLRTSLIPGMLQAIQWNLNRSVRDLQFYELSKVYSPEGERRVLLLGACGNRRPAGIHETVRAFDFYDMKGDVEDLLERYAVSVDEGPETVPHYYHPGRFLGMGGAAMFGELHPEQAGLFKIRQRVYIAEIEIDSVLSLAEARRLRRIPKFPAIRRDFSLLLDKSTPYAAVREAVEAAGIQELIRMEPFDRMETGLFPETQYSLSVSVTYQSPERTLTDVEVENFDRRILKSLQERLSAQLRN